MKRNIQTQLIVAYIALATTPLLLMGLIFVWQTLTIQQQRAFSTQDQLANQIALEIETVVSGFETQIQVVARTINLTQLTTDDQLRILRELRNTQPAFNQLRFLDASGQEVVRDPQPITQNLARVTDYSQRDEFVIPRDSGQVFYDIFRNEITFEPKVIVAVPFYDLETTEFGGVIVAEARLAVIWNVLSDIEPEAGQSFFVVNESGTVIGHQNPEIPLRDFSTNILDNSPVNDPWLRFLQWLIGPSVRIGLSENPAERPMVIWATEAIPIAEERLFVVVQQSIYDAFILVIEAFITIGLAMVVTFALAGWVAMMVIQQIVRPIQQMVTAAQAISAGDLLQQVEVKSNNELGVLAQTFNEMANKLYKSISNLENRVRQRTKALETASAISRQIAGILDLNVLLSDVVRRIQTEFGYHHLHVYLVSEHGRFLYLAYALGESEERLSDDHDETYTLPIGQPETAQGGLITQAVRTQSLALYNDMAELPITMQHHPSIISTRSELIVPLRKAEEVVGVLDIHSRQQYRFSDDDVSLMQSIADQLAIAITNSQQLAKTQAALEEVERLNRQLTHESWQQTLADSPQPVIGYRFKRGVVQPVYERQSPQPTLPDQAAPQRGQPQQDNQATVSVPLTLRGQIIGSLGIRRPADASWETEELVAVGSVAEQVSLALENARLSVVQERTIVKLQELDRLKSEFLTSMSHELRTPLNAILGFADVLLAGIDGDLPDVALNDVRLIYSSGQHLLTLINDILDISKIEAGMMEIVPEPLDVKLVVNEVVAAANSFIKKTVQIRLDLPDELPLLYADNIRLKQILLNLVGNAAKFTQEGTIILRVSYDEALTGFARLSVIDTGIGIPPQKQKTIFERFRQADMTTTKEFGGTGLGLAICKQLVEMHGGEIGVHSQVGQGSEFYFTIPLASSAR